LQLENIRAEIHCMRVQVQRQRNEILKLRSQWKKPRSDSWHGNGLLKKVFFWRSFSSPRQAPLQGPPGAPAPGRFVSRVKKRRKVACIDIVRRAYQLWQEAGEPEGRDWDFYLQAERELQEAADEETPEDM
jgi:hypothetical protein